MNGSREQMALDFDPQLAANPAVCRRVERRQERRSILRIVDYSPFPRAAADEQVGTGFAKNESAAGLCIAMGSAQVLGALLRVVVRGVDGTPTRDAIVRVVWCRAQQDGDYHVGLELMRESSPRMLLVRRDHDRREVAITA
ncbi:MAG: PilZ domain-containing protein [Deltaproteobacteria bacterium]|nr:PilZ domain-containing protein [Deltaproteobacteria bacterium]MBW2420770.1 PilZ domain-containing protein [Deltaproteobacteria bacterium]